MKTDIFNFDLPQELIAQAPVNPRDSSRLLHISDQGTFTDMFMHQFDSLLTSNDVLIFNNTKVIPARLYGTKGQAHVEVTLFKQVNTLVWDTLIKNSRRLKKGDIITFSDKLRAQVLNKTDKKEIPVQFLCSAEELMPLLYETGKMPLPPYIKRTQNNSYSDHTTYQTIYAKHEGAVAAPTAGLHFTQNLLQRLQEKGISLLFVTLHVGGGTFLPVSVQDTDDHIMHAEYGEISKEVAHQINLFKQQGKRIIPVGTTSLRLIESATDSTGIIHPFAQETNIFITPGYKFKITDALLTNFHLSGSTLFMLVSALAGIKTMKEAYQYAIKQKYRFFSYGDACFIEKKEASL